MALSAASQVTGARTGEQFLEGLRQGGREIWLRGERISHPLDHPELTRRGPVAGARLRPPARARLRDAGAFARCDAEPSARERHPRDPAGPRGSGPPPAGVRVGGGAVGRGDGPHAGLPERDIRLLRRALGRVGAAGRHGAGCESRRLPGVHARPRSLDHARADEPPGGPHQARGRAGHGAGVATQDRGDRRCRRRARGADAGHAGAVRRRVARLSGLGHPAAGRALRAVIRHPDRHTGAAVYLP